MTSRKIVACTLLGLTPAFAGCSTMNGRIGNAHPVPPGTVPAQSIPTHIGTLSVPACAARDGTPVQYVVDEGPLDSPFAYKTRGGLAETIELAESGLPSEPGAYIVLNTRLLGMMSGDRKMLVMAHECAHQRLGHTGRPITSEKQVRRYENEADCEAVKIMRREFGYSSAQIRHAIGIFKQPPFNSADDSEHGTGSERYARSLKCMLPG
jgi:hypothetical protein